MGLIGVCIVSVVKGDVHPEEPNIPVQFFFEDLTATSGKVNCVSQACI